MVDRPYTLLLRKIAIGTTIYRTNDLLQIYTETEGLLGALSLDRDMGRSFFASTSGYHMSMYFVPYRIATGDVWYIKPYTVLSKTPAFIK